MASDLLQSKVNNVNLCIIYRYIHFCFNLVFSLLGNISTSSELRMKLCEAIIKTCQLCNELLPMYTSVILSALMTGVKDKDSAIRASSLAAIGEICGLLKFSIGSIIFEVRVTICTNCSDSMVEYLNMA